MTLFYTLHITHHTHIHRMLNTGKQLTLQQIAQGSVIRNRLHKQLLRLLHSPHVTQLIHHCNQLQSAVRVVVLLQIHNYTSRNNITSTISTLSRIRQHSLSLRLAERMKDFTALEELRQSRLRQNVHLPTIKNTCNLALFFRRNHSAVTKNTNLVFVVNSPEITHFVHLCMTT